jgi:hypothetical protein
MHFSYAAPAAGLDINQINAWKLNLAGFDMTIRPASQPDPIDDALLFFQTHDMNQLSTTPEFQEASYEVNAEFYAQLNGVPAPDFGPGIDLMWGSMSGGGR